MQTKRGISDPSCVLTVVATSSLGTLPGPGETQWQRIPVALRPNTKRYLLVPTLMTLSETDLVLMHQFDVDEMVSTRHNDENNGSVTKVPETNAAKLAKTQCTTLGSHNGMRERSPDIDMSRKVRARTEPGPIPKVLRNVACPFCKKTGLLTAIAQHLEAGCNGATMAGLDAWLLHWEDQMHKLGALIAPRIVPDDRAGLC
ncbi:hypothetical protein BC832DRAFT_541420 [Gaertneriomyces semiglobifer]|nr:hypothetical protein BC832DRAFT_541420 [Gaertneriomyces semiglobifer]